jgi:hypothetical protein
VPRKYCDAENIDERHLQITLINWKPFNRETDMRTSFFLIANTLHETLLVSKLVLPGVLHIAFHRSELYSVCYLLGLLSSLENGGGTSQKLT